MCREHEADGRKAVAVVDEVQRGHRHDQHHHHLAGEHADDGQSHVRLREQAQARRRRRAGDVDLRLSRGQGRGDGKRGQHPDHHEGKAALERIQADAGGHARGRGEEVRPEHRAHGAAPHDDPDHRRAVLRRGSVRRRVAGELDRPVADAQAGARHEQQDERAHAQREDRPKAAEHTDREAELEAEAAPASRHDHRQQRGGECGGRDPHRVRQPGAGAFAGQRRGGQRTDGEGADVGGRRAGHHGHVAERSGRAGVDETGCVHGVLFAQTSAPCSHRCPR